MFNSLNRRLFYSRSKSKVIPVLFLLFVVIGTIASAYYFTEISLSNKDAASDGPFASIPSQIQETVNFISSESSSIIILTLATLPPPQLSGLFDAVISLAPYDILS
jgi:hypothetical protein